MAKKDFRHVRNERPLYTLYAASTTTAYQLGAKIRFSPNKRGSQATLTDVNATSVHGWTALMMAAYGSRVEIAEMLFSHGADINAKSEEGFTALMWAEKTGQQGMLELLKEHGAE